MGKKMGRPRINLPFEEAREVARSERIESRGQYLKWHDLNKPAGLPRRPDRAYKHDFISWNDFLGNNNPFPIQRVKYRPFNEARAYAQSLHIKTRAEWFEICDSKKKPEDIPRRPDLYYRKKDEWISWGNFLGVNFQSRTETLTENDSIFYMIYNPKAPRNFLKCGITKGGKSSLIDYTRKNEAQIVLAYQVEDSFRVDEFMETHGSYESHEYNGYYKITSLTQIKSELSFKYNAVK